MVFLLTVLTASYLAVVLWVRRAVRAARHQAAVPTELLPAEDRPPASAVGWPPDGEAFRAYVEQGIAALDAYLSEGFAA